MPRERGKQVGLAFNFEAIQRAPNSELSHRLVKLAPEAKQEAVLDAVYTAYFEDGQDIGDLTTLLEIAEKEGLQPNTLRAKLEAGAARKEVQEEARQAQRLGISGVPFFIVDRKLAFSGAQPPEVILSALQQAAQAQSGH
jgi:predicted DsbA family dithiol-disulfide isomerase